ncbi:MAG: fumarylacetoacetate hydrolase family protein [Bacteroidia bacterium]|nr:fumarylacetoacetate hydrolase family protein [Bacteroidia bacterium]
MKIICLCRNYFGSHPPHQRPVFFLKPETTITYNNKPFFLPSFSKQVYFETEIVFKICRVGKNISEKFAHHYYDEIGIGIDFTEFSILKECQKNGHPWEAAKSFDGSSPVSKFFPKKNFPDINNINFSLKLNGNTVQTGNTGNMIFSTDKIIAHVSRFFTIKMGDLVFTGTPSGAGPVTINDRLQTYIEDELMMDFKIK